MDHRVLVRSNNKNDNHRNQNYTCTKQPPATTRQKQTTHITPESDPGSSNNTVERVNSNNILQAALRPSTILKYKTYQTKWYNYCTQKNISHIQPKISELLDYFTHLYD